MSTSICGEKMAYDFNHLERKASEYLKSGDFDKAIAIFLYMADGDTSLDGGYLGQMLGHCYEQKGELFAARYWYGRAVEENPDARIESATARERLSYLTIDNFL